MPDAAEQLRRFKAAGAKLRSIICPLCMRRPHPHTVTPLAEGSRCDWSDCGNGDYITLRPDHVIADEELA